MKSYHAFARRLADFEAQQAPPAPDEVALADALTADEVLNEAAWGLHDTVLVADNFATLRCLVISVDRGARYWQRVAERANALCAQHGWWICALTRSEALDAISAMESGMLRLRPLEHDRPGPLPMWDFLLIPPWQHPRSTALWALGFTVHNAFWGYAQQTGALAARDTPMDVVTLRGWLDLVVGKRAQGGPDA
jgi:hypothetical protein